MKSSQKEEPWARNHDVYISILLWLLVFSYTIGNILLHRRANESANLIKNLLSLPSYLFVLRVSGMIGLTGLLFYLGRKIMRNSRRLKMLLLFIPLMLMVDLSLIVVPIERIHYLQYGFLTWICYKASGKQFLSAVMAFFSGVVDEAYQYWVLYGDNPDVYLDWNDIGLNLIGILAVLFFFLPEIEKKEKVQKKPILVSIFLWAIAATLVVFFFDPDQYLIRNDPYKGSSSFWITSGINTTYHIMNSLEGLISLGVILILTTGYYLPNRYPRAGPRHFSTTSST